MTKDPAAGGSELIALLPMKGHSERLPDKNIRELAGRPLFFWLADTLRDSGLCSVLCVNTDSDRIKSLARRRYGKNWLLIHDRAPELIGDTVPMNAVIAHDLARLDKAALFVQVHSTTPFLGSRTLGIAVTQFREALCVGYDSMFCVTEHHSRFYDHALTPVNHDARSLGRTQDLPPVYEDNSNFYLFTYDSFSRAENRIGANPKIFPTPAGSYEFQDIDTPEEWAHAEMIAKCLSRADRTVR